MAKAVSCTDHLENKFDTLDDMCKFWNINKCTYKDRILRNWSKEKALTTQVPTKSRKDHLGNIFPSISAMCKHYNIHPNIYRQRLKYGWSQEEALTTPPQQPATCKDHLGNEFAHETAMCKYWNVDWSTYKRRMNLNWSQEKALTTTARQVKDHIGNEFATTQDMCKYWNVSVNAYRKRIKQNWSIKDALTTPIRQNTCEDHLGNKFNNTKAMCKYWNISYVAYRGRIKQNWSMKDALTTPMIPTCRQETDPFGNTFTSITELCQNYHMNAKIYLQRTRQLHHSQIEALQLIPSIRTTTHWTFDKKLQIIKPIENQYFLCIFHNHEIIMHYDKIIEYCTEQLQVQYQQGGQEWLKQYLAQTI